MPRTSASNGARRSRRQRGSISADEIVKGAFEVARDISLDKLSMPTLAERLDVGVTSIYWYFRKKEDLLDTMTDVAVDTYVHAMPPLAGGTWQDAMRQHFAAQRRIFDEDQTLVDLILIRTSTYSRDATRRMFELVEAVLALLVDQGFTPDNALRVYNTVSVYTRGIVMHDRVLRLSHAPTLDNGQRRMTDWGTMPILEALVDKYSFAGTLDADFEFGVDRLICGSERLLEEQDRKVPTNPKRATRTRAPAKRAGAAR